MHGSRTSFGRRIAIAIVSLLALVASLGPAPASAQTDRAAYMINMLAVSTAFRVRAQAALRLGDMPPSPAITQALVTALRDTDDSVRAAAAQSLGRVGDSSALSALRALDHDSATPVRQAATAAIAAITARGSGGAPPTTGTGTGTAPPSGAARYYIGVGDAGSTVSGLSPTVLAAARTAVVSSITTTSGVVVAPAGESAAAARSAITAQHLRGIFLDISITDVSTRPGGATHVAVSVVVQDYPSHNIRATLSGGATASGASQQALVEAALQGALRSLPAALAAP